MVGVELLVVLGILLLFGLLVVYIIYSERKGRAAKIELSRSLGFSPIDPEPELIQRIVRLYQNLRKNGHAPADDQFQLQNVACKRLPDYDLFIFDLLNRSGDEDSYIEDGALAVVSPHLELPTFLVFPKADIEGTLSFMGNKFLTWIFTKVGNPIEFPECPEFERRYLVSSPDPAGTCQFLNESRLHQMAKTRLMSIQAGGDLFTISRVDQFTKPVNVKETMSTRIQLARDVFLIFVG